MSGWTITGIEDDLMKYIDEKKKYTSNQVLQMMQSMGTESQRPRKTMGGELQEKELCIFRLLIAYSQKMLI